MSLLNLNTSAGRAPRGKKSLKMFMGAGLLVAVLGIGSTLASNIILNGPELTTEFGQGTTQTVYCGGDKSVTITPMSAYQNTVKGNDTPAQNAKTANIRVLKTSSEFTETGSVTVSSAGSYRVTIKVKTDTGSVPRWGESVENSTTTGFWLTSATSTSNVVVSPTTSELQAGILGNSSNPYFFAPEISLNSGTYKRVKSSTSGVDNRQVVLQNATNLIPGVVTAAASFKVGGVKISGIDPACIGVNFVVSSYAATGEAQTLISTSSADAVKEVAALWTGTDDAIVVSKDRVGPVSTSLVSATQNSKELIFKFNTATGTALTADNLYKIVVETQEDTLS